MSGCADCFKEPRSRRDQYLLVIENAKKYSNEKQVQVVVFSTGDGHDFAEFQGDYPGGTVDHIMPCRPGDDGGL